MENEIRKNYNNMRALSNRLQQIREEERLNISRELHDDLGQTLTGLKMDIAVAEKKLSAKRIDKKIIVAKLSSMRELTDLLIKKVRKLAQEMRPNILDSFGLIPAVSWMLTDFEQRSGISTALITEIEHLNAGKDVVLEVFRIIQESVTNVIRHSEADSVSVLIKAAGNNYEISIIDNGKGIAPKNMIAGNSLGILGMRERAEKINGSFAIFRNDDQGTTVKLIFPIG